MLCYNISMSKITKYLNQLITGNVFDAPEILDAYSVDRSILKITPKLVALPESTDDICKLMRFFNQLSTKEIKVGVTVRGSGLDKMGADLGNGVIISTEKLNHLMEFDARERLVRVQSGITLRELNTALSVSGLTIPIGADENETIGGLISNCPTDSYSGKYGGIMNFVERAEIVLANGECIQTGRISKYAVAKKATEKSLEGDIYRKLYKLIQKNADLLKSLRTKNTSSTGYSTIAYTSRKDTLDLLPLFFSAEGSLGIISEIILRAVPLKKRPARVVATFPKLETALKFCETINEIKPRELDICDLRVLKTAEESGKNLSKITRKLESGFVVFASFDEKTNIIVRKLTGLAKVLPKTAKCIIESQENRLVLDEFENSITNFLYVAHSGERVPLLTDFYLPAHNLPKFIDDLSVLESKLKLDLPLFGSYSSSNYSLRPVFDLSDPEFKKKAVTFLKVGAYILDRQEGSITGGSPEGRIKALITNTKLSDEEKKLYNDIKEIFDQNNILNPGIKLGADTRFTLNHFRATSSAKIVI